MLSSGSDQIIQISQDAIMHWHDWCPASVLLSSFGDIGSWFPLIKIAAKKTCITLHAKVDTSEKQWNGMDPLHMTSPAQNSALTEGQWRSVKTYHWLRVVRCVYTPALFRCLPSVMDVNAGGLLCEDIRNINIDTTVMLCLKHTIFLENLGYLPKAGPFLIYLMSK